MGLFTKQKKKECQNLCVKMRKSVMDETLEYLRSIRKELEVNQQQKQQVA